MIAQITNAVGAAGLPDPNDYGSIGWVLVILAAIVTGARQAIGFWRDLTKTGTEVSPQPLMVQAVSDCVKEKDCLERHGALTAQMAELRAYRVQDAKDGAASRKGIYEEIKGVQRQMGEHIDEVRRELSQKIDTMPAQIVAQLLNSKQLFKDR